MGKGLEDFGMQTAQQAAGSIMGLVLGGIEDRRQVRQQKRLTNIQIEAQKHLTDFNTQKQLQLWKDTSYPAQMEMLEKAGLNPGLIYGMGGGGGATAAISQGTAGGGQAQRGTEITQMAQTAAQMGLLRAQKENIEADTANKKAQTEKTAGVDTTEAKTRTEGIHLNNEFLKRTLEDRIDQINTDANKAIAELDITEGMRDRERMTRVADTEKAQTEAMKAVLENILIEAQTKGANQSIEESKQRVITMQAEIGKWAQEISQGWNNLDRQERELRLKTWVEDVKAKNPGLWNVIGGWLYQSSGKLGELLGDKPFGAPKTHK